MLECSISSTHGAGDGVMQSASEISSIVSSFPPNVTSPELHTAEAPTTTKVSCLTSIIQKAWCKIGCLHTHLTSLQDLGAVVPPPPVIAGAEHSGNVLSDSLLTTGDALDKYQHLSQKVIRYSALTWLLSVDCYSFSSFMYELRLEYLSPFVYGSVIC